MEVLDPRMAVIVGVGGAVIGSHRVRSVIGRGAGYTAKGVMTVARPVVRPMIQAGEEIMEEARHTVEGNGAAKAPATPVAAAPATPAAPAAAPTTPRRRRPAAS